MDVKTMTLAKKDKMDFSSIPQNQFI